MKLLKETAYCALAVVVVVAFATVASMPLNWILEIAFDAPKRLTFEEQLRGSWFAFLFLCAVASPAMLAPVWTRIENYFCKRGSNG